MQVFSLVGSPPSVFRHEAATLLSIVYIEWIATLHSAGTQRTVCCVTII